MPHNVSPCFVRRKRLFAELLFEGEPFRGAATHARDAESRPGAIGSQPAERLRRALERLDAHAFAGDGLAERDNVRLHFHAIVRERFAARFASGR